MIFDNLKMTSAQKNDKKTRKRRKRRRKKKNVGTKATTTTMAGVKRKRTEAIVTQMGEGVSEGGGMTTMTRAQFKKRLTTALDTEIMVIPFL